MVNIGRDDFKPSPSSRICSHHFEGSCFFKSTKGQVCLKKTAVPTKFLSVDPFKIAWCTKLYRRRRNVENYENPEFHTYSLKMDSGRRYVEEEVILDEYVKEEEEEEEVDALDQDMEEDASDQELVETSVMPVIYPTEICVIAVRHDHCYRSIGDPQTTTDMQENEAQMLKRSLNLVLGKIEACRKKIKLKNTAIKRLKRKVASLSSELKAKKISEKKRKKSTS
ncbi:THAP domain-containing protein [Pimephales promelas]|nr:THAP domain-containing protein [Pimephales promelas]KAG1944381.1 THAP domain-containing protein [Pimephales promelas]